MLTTPVIRCVKQQLNNTKVHFVTKEVFKETLIHNPYIDKLHTFKNDISELYQELRFEKFDCVIDLHKNLRSLRLKQKLSIKSYSFNKLNVQKFLAVNLKSIKSLPAVHIVDRYFETVKDLGVRGDNKGLDYFISDTDKINMTNYLSSGAENNYLALVIGGSYYTKQIPSHKLFEICQNARLPVVLLGDKGDEALGNDIQAKNKNVINLCGKLRLNQSASVIQQAGWVLTPDTGLMHIAAAYNKKIISVWGNTIPEFGMRPYQPMPENQILEIKGLKCRPCSKLGYKKCPKGNFRCMNEIDFSFISNLA